MSAAHPSCDAATAVASAERGRAIRPNLILTTCILASSLAFLDGSVVNVALPSIAHDLAAATATLQWIVNAYLLPLGALLLLGGAAGDRFGRRRLLIAGTSLLAAASLVCTVAGGIDSLLAGRFLQGVGAAMLMPNSLAIVGGSFEGEAKGRAVGIWAATGAAMGALGPVLGGWLVDVVGWRAIFLLNLPLALGAVIVAGGFALLVRIDTTASYVAQVLPAILVIAIGLSGAVAPLTTAVLGSVDARHVGSASGFNSAVARTEGLIATALIGTVLAARGEALVARFHVTAFVCAGACLLAGAAAFALVRPPRKNGPPA